MAALMVMGACNVFDSYNNDDADSDVVRSSLHRRTNELAFLRVLRERPGPQARPCIPNCPPARKPGVQRGSREPGRPFSTSPRKALWPGFTRVFRLLQAICTKHYLRTDATL